MSKHNNSLNPCMDARCKCGRYITIGESKSRGHIIGQYECPTCYSYNAQKRFEESKKLSNSQQK